MSRHAKHINGWLHEWAGREICGARTKHSAPDLAWITTTKIDLAKAGQIPDIYLGSLDHPQCFDSLDRGVLVAAAECLGIDVLVYACQNYANLIRYCYVDNTPTDVVVGGCATDNSFGIPQGCPAATTLCNLAAYLWVKQMSRTNPEVKVYTYLDDWIIQAPDWMALSKTTDDTKAFLHAVIGPKLNLGKCVVASATHNGPAVMTEGACQDIPRVSHFKYLGIDVAADVLPGYRGLAYASRLRPVAARRLERQGCVKLYTKTAGITARCCSNGYHFTAVPECGIQIQQPRLQEACKHNGDLTPSNVLRARSEFP